MISFQFDQKQFRFSPEVIFAPKKHETSSVCKSNLFEHFIKDCRPTRIPTFKNKIIRKWPESDLLCENKMRKNWIGNNECVAYMFIAHFSLYPWGIGFPARSF